MAEELELPMGLESGRGATPVVALHGFTGGGGDFEALAHRWRDRARLLAPDLPGHGAAPDRPVGLSVAARAVVRSVDTRGVRRPLLLGYSMGGRLALRLAVDHPGWARALVLVGARPGLADGAARATRAALDESRAQDAESSVARFLEAWRQVPLIATQEDIPAPWRDRLRLRRAQCRGAGLAASLRGMGLGAMEPLWSALPDLELPVLLVVGATDDLYRRLAHEMAAALPNAQVEIIPGAGHAAHLEAAGTFAARVGRWVGALS